MNAIARRASGLKSKPKYQQVSQHLMGDCADDILASLCLVENKSMKLLLPSMAILKITKLFSFLSLSVLVFPSP